MDASPIETFLRSVRERAGALDDRERHELEVAAKTVRRAVEAGREVDEKTWARLFPSSEIRALARRLLSAVSITDLDFAATVVQSTPEPSTAVSGTMAVAPEAVQRKWHALMASIPDEGLPADDGSSTVDGMELGRMILQVSQGKGSVDFARLPSARRFRERFIDAARDAQRLDLVDGLPDDLS